ncbi:DUF4374 domain-containing protein [Crocinitomix algicola]|uniref:DUF4374 domain-containing protein n=1 Tax=Crocinitomix algicola TaxID=1740263 RepID=UPI0008304F8C|nr:DUF4374 domain-containing protein [Crocinitomix algicola]
MKRIHLNLAILATGVLTVTSSCKKDEEPTPVGETKVNYVMSLRSLDASEESADYYLTVNDLMSGEISAVGQGEELVGWNYNGHFGDTYFAFGYDLNECVGYKIQQGQLHQTGKFVFERFDVMNAIDDEYFMAIGAPWGGGSYDCQLQQVNIEDVAIHRNKKHPIYESFHEGEQLNAWPTSSYVQGNRLYVSFYPLNGATWETPNTDTAFVSIYSYPDLEYIKTIKDSRTGPIGYYGGQPCILETETGDHYTLSSGSMSAGFTQATKPSAILKINAGAEEFDADYYFDIEASGYRVTSATYVGDGLAVANVIDIATDEAAAAVNQWALFSEVTPLLNTAIIDLYSQTVTIVNDVPLHGGQYATPFLVEGNDVYISVNDGTDAYVYKVNAQSGTATRGAKLIGNQFQGLFKGNA